MKTPVILATAACLLLPIAAQAGDTRDGGITTEIRQELADASREVRTELAQASRDLETDNLRVDNSLRFGDDGRASKDLPRAGNCSTTARASSKSPNTGSRSASAAPMRRWMRSATVRCLAWSGAA